MWASGGVGRRLGRQLPTEIINVGRESLDDAVHGCDVGRVLGDVLGDVGHRLGWKGGHVNEPRHPARGAPLLGAVGASPAMLADRVQAHPEAGGGLDGWDERGRISAFQHNGETNATAPVLRAPRKGDHKVDPRVECLAPLGT